MFITFTHANGTPETVEIGDGSGIIPQYSNGLGALDLPVYTVPSGTTPVQSNFTSGSPAGVISNGGYYLRFFNGVAKTILVTKFRMDDAAALDTARITIDTALLANTEVLNLLPDGSAGS